jgi:Ca-activated chloride channel family protein
MILPMIRPTRRLRRPLGPALLLSVGALVGALPGAGAVGGAPPPPAAEGFGGEVSVGYVLVPVIVRSPAGGYANHLRQKDFTLRIDSRKVAVESFETRAEAPASIIFLQDLSGSMATGGHLAQSREIVRYFLDHAFSGDEFAVATFAGAGRRVEVPFTADAGRVRADISRWEPYGTTALHDAVAWLPEISLAGRNPKRFAILVTDGVDNASTVTPEEAREIVRAAQLPVYVLGMGSGDPYSLLPGGEKTYRYADVLNLLAYESGGRYYPLAGAEDLEKALAAIAADLRHEYVLGFSTGEGKSRYREIEVDVAGRNRSVLFRRGYKGPPPNGVAGG